MFGDSAEMMSYILKMGFVALALLVIIYLILRLLFRLESKAKSPYAILEERFATGEISGMSKMFVGEEKTSSSK